jgi:uncharacterized Zn finger protein
MAWDWRDWGYFPPSRPRPAKGGIRSQSKRGVFGESWWARRWVEVLESFDIGGRLQRGRRYARSGQVLSIDIARTVIRARVQGSRPSPYEITIRVAPLAEQAWKKVAQAATSQAVFAAKLLAGDMPREIEEVFRAAGSSLFPARDKDLKTECSCPDWSNPCKHIAAVYYLLGEEFDRDPFLILKMRGMDRKAFLALLGGAPEKRKSPEKKEVASREPLPAEPSAFWSAKPLPENLVTAAQHPSVWAALPRRLGGFPFWRGAENLLDFLEPIYAAAHGRASQVLETEEL